MTFPVELLSKCWFLAGPTACGKTAASLHLAERIEAEIIALDSMTLYRGMDIGTAKPTVDQQSRVRHHLVDILDPQDECCLADYLSAAEAACGDVISRGLTPLFVGGAGLYLRGLLRGVFKGPPADWSIRRQWEDRVQIDGPGIVFEQLRRVDPTSAQRLHPNDHRRIIRALEIYELTGQPMSKQLHEGPRPIDQRPEHVYWLSPPRDWLYERINSRVEQMFSAGLIDEVRRLVAYANPLSHTARQALGYKEIIDWFDRDSSLPTTVDMARCALPPRISLDEVRMLIQTRTRQFAKRQHTWFRNLTECRAIEMNGSETPEQLALLLLP